MHRHFHLMVSFLIANSDWVISFVMPPVVTSLSLVSITCPILVILVFRSYQKQIRFPIELAIVIAHDTSQFTS